MSTELLPCPCCNGKAIICKPLWAIAGWVIRCETTLCLEMGLPAGRDKPEDLVGLIAAWNRRFVCLDRNGKKVFSDSKFHVWSKDALCFVWDPDFLRWRTKWIEGKSKGESCDALFTCFEIELIESDGAE